jgi:16S rRNA (adenine1518-N6/adenine1519-N6)-dimethyltransferase
MKKREEETWRRGDTGIASRRSKPTPRQDTPESAAAAFHPSKRFGQNFLTNPAIVTRIIEALDPNADETIIEIGPGKGVLTEPLLERAGSLVAIEFDQNLIPLLSDRFKSKSNFKLIQKDALAIDFCAAIRPAIQARVIANLPYNVATAILQRLIEQRHCLTELVVMLQKEVVDRITAPPGTPERGYLSVFAQKYCDVEKLFEVAPSSFRPAPKVWSSVVRLILRPGLSNVVRNEKLLWQVVSAGFAQRRKTMLNNLRNAPNPLQEIVKSHGGASIILCQAEVDLQRRAETLTLDEWARIAGVLE